MVNFIRLKISNNIKGVKDEKINNITIFYDFFISNLHRQLGLELELMQEY